MSEPDEAEEAPLDPALERALEIALRAAWRPEPLDPERHERILELALEDPLAPATREEIADSERLRDALEGRAAHPDLALARALSAALGKAGEAPPPVRETAAASKSAGRVIYVAFGAATTLLAAAAALLLVVGTLSRKSESVAQHAAPSLSVSRSSAPLFSDPFTTEGTTARIDRITSERERELRQNRYLAWGVR
jgi:hypothetical protein